MGTEDKNRRVELLMNPMGGLEPNCAGRTCRLNTQRKGTIVSNASRMESDGGGFGGRCTHVGHKHEERTGVNQVVRRRGKEPICIRARTECGEWWLAETGWYQSP